MTVPVVGVCHVAVVEDVAVSTWPVEGAVAAATSMLVVADLSALVDPEVNPLPVPVMFVPTRVDGVPRLGVTRVGEVAKTAAPVPVSSVSEVAS